MVKTGQGDSDPVQTFHAFVFHLSRNMLKPGIMKQELSSASGNLKQVKQETIMILDAWWFQNLPTNPIEQRNQLRKGAITITPSKRRM